MQAKAEVRFCQSCAKDTHHIEVFGANHKPRLECGLCLKNGTMPAEVFSEPWMEMIAAMATA